MSGTTHGPGVAHRASEGPENPYVLLTPTQRSVYALLEGYPEGVCRRTFGLHDIYEVANRITEIEDRLGITIDRQRCAAHDHRRRIVRYSLK